MEKTDPKELDEGLALKLFVVLNRAQEAVQKQATQDIKRYGLNLSEFAVLELLYNKGEQPIQMIGKKVLLASSSMTYVIDKLAKKEYLARRACPNDRRVTYAHLTDQGMELMKDIFPQHQTAMATIFASLTKEEKEMAITLIKKAGSFVDEQ
ncbi:MAG TPA: MarR family transcriptional regulator [Candidatus Avamphibacillus sp.]|nr:MarR family transcriptional regulator [Candidatus Avamphibacillus sp.]